MLGSCVLLLYLILSNEIHAALARGRRAECQRVEVPIILILVAPSILGPSATDPLVAMVGIPFAMGGSTSMISSPTMVVISATTIVDACQSLWLVCNSLDVGIMDLYRALKRVVALLKSSRAIGSASICAFMAIIFSFLIGVPFKKSSTCCLPRDGCFATSSNWLDHRCLLQ